MHEDTYKDPSWCAFEVARGLFGCTDYRVFGEKYCNKKQCDFDRRLHNQAASSDRDTAGPNTNTERGG